VIPRRLGLLLALATLFIAGCAHRTLAPGPIDNQDRYWTGRLSLLVQSDPVQSLSGGFELLGDAGNGQLLLTNPLGGAVARVRWTPDGAELDSGGQTRSYPSVGALLEQLTGAAIPMDALFQWLRGQSAEASGWTADLSRIGEGRLQASRDSPQPAVTLRVVLER
jgi:outer membrane lipoprotein LolB